MACPQDEPFMWLNVTKRCKPGDCPAKYLMREHKIHKKKTPPLFEGEFFYFQATDLDWAACQTIAD